MAPDFEYFLRLPRSWSHSASGMLLFCLPVGLASLWIFHRVLKLPVLTLLPESHQQRLITILEPFRFGPTRRFIFVVTSLLFGTFTHLVWDSFTHQTGWLIRRVALLNMTVFNIHATQVRVCLLLQYGSSALGLGLLCFLYWRWIQKTPAQEVVPIVRIGTAPKLRIIAGLTLIAALWALCYWLAIGGGFGSLWLPLIKRATLAFSSAFVAELLVFSIAWNLRVNKRAF